MKIFYFRYLLATGDGVGKGWTNDLLQQRDKDPTHGYVEIAASEYAALSPELYYYENSQITPKTKLELQVDKPHIEIGKETATISWEASQPVRMIVNGHPHPASHNNNAQIKIDRSGTHTFRILDSRHYSDPIQITAEDYGRDTHTSAAKG